MTVRAIVTGASSGIGRETAVALSAAGIETVLVARRRDALLETAARCTAPHQLFVADLTKPGSEVEVVDFAQSLGDGVKPVLINAAGMAEFGSIEALTADSLQRQIEINLLAPARLCHEVLPWMLKEGSGHIVNVLSVVATQPLLNTGAYAAAKAGLLMFGKVLSAEVRRKGILITSVLPGAVDTPIWDEMDFKPNRADMIPSSMVAEAIVHAVLAGPKMAVDELHLMPPKGLL